MHKFLSAAAAVLIVAGATSAFAANSDQGSSDQAPTSMNVKKQLESNLSNAGYSDIEVTPTSFFVKAKNKRGTPVMMVIGPDSVTEVIAAPNSNGSGSAKSEGSSASDSK